SPAGSRRGTIGAGWGWSRPRAGRRSRPPRCISRRADMLLCIDCGNTNTVMSIWDGERFLATFRTVTEGQRTADQYFVWLSTLMQHSRVPWQIDEVIISSTAPRVMFNLRVFADRYCKTRPLVVGKPGCLLPHQPRVEPGTQVGPDRI